jgi:hypothetical protein
MLRDPTIEDFAHWVQFHLDKAIKSTHDACHVVERRNNAKGLLRSGNNIIECFDAAYGEFDKGVEAALGELRVAMVKGVLDKTLLRETVEMQNASVRTRYEARVEGTLIPRVGPGPSEGLGRKGR